MKTQAKIVDTALGLQVVVIVDNDRRLWVDWPILYPHNGQIAYNCPERIPESIKPKVRQLLVKLHADRNGVTLSDQPDYLYVYSEGKDRYGMPTYFVGNHDGSVKYPILGWTRGKHNWTGYRVDFWYIGPDHRVWHGVQYGEKRPCPNWHCKVNPTKRYHAYATHYQAY